MTALGWDPFAALNHSTIQILQPRVETNRTKLTSFSRLVLSWVVWTQAQHLLWRHHLRRHCHKKHKCKKSQRWWQSSGQQQQSKQLEPCVCFTGLPQSPTQPLQTVGAAGHSRLRKCALDAMKIHHWKNDPGRSPIYCTPQPAPKPHLCPCHAQRKDKSLCSTHSVCTTFHIVSQKKQGLVCDPHRGQISWCAHSQPNQTSVTLIKHFSTQKVELNQK